MLNIFYEEEQPLTQTSLQNLKPEDLTVMSPEWLDKLYHGTKLLDDNLVLELIAEIPKTHSSLADKLTRLVDCFQIDEITDLIEKVNFKN